MSTEAPNSLLADPCPVCGGPVVAVQKIDDHDSWDLTTPPIDTAQFTFSPCGHEISGRDPRMQGWTIRRHDRS